MLAPFAPSRVRWSLSAFVLLVIAACGSRVSGVGGSDGGVSTGTVSGTSGSSIVGTSGANSGAMASGSIVGASGMVASGSAGPTSGAGGGSSGALTSSGALGAPPVGDGGPMPIPSGCGKALTVATGMWVAQPVGCAQGMNNQGTAACQAIPPGGTVLAKATQGSPEYRGWWVYVPTGYDASRPYPVIYNAPGCFEGNGLFNAGEDGYPYNTVDNGQAILVGLDYDTYSEVPGCYDNRDPQSNDFTFFPWLQSQIESEFCVDKSHEFFSGYSSGAQLAQQLNCAFPDKLRGFASVTGCEPGSPAFPGAQYSPCVSKPTAAFFVKDFDDADNPYACILPACARVLAQNGCTTTTCNPLDTTTTTPYVVPKGVTPPAGTKCVSFNGCPAHYPVVFCVTYNQNHSDDQNWGVVPLFWSFMSQLDSSLCPTGQVYQNGACAPCPAGETACGVACVNEQTDSNNCGSCGTQCLVGSSCQSGSCSCPGGQTKCNGICVSEPTDPGNCGACATRCGGDAPFCYQGACTTSPSSCQPGGLGLSNCGANSESCCTSLEVTGGSYYRTYDARSLQGVPDVAADGGATDWADPATVSSFRLDKYLVTVGRFRQFVNAVLPRDGGTGWLPPPGSGKHNHLNGGDGLAATGGGFEPGWLASDDANIAPTDSNLTANGGYATWTSSPGVDENLPVTDATWYEAYAFCIWDGGFLPSDAESEYAAAGGAQQREYPWGATAPGTANDYAIFGDGNGLCYFTSGGACAVAPVGYAAQGAGLFGQLDLAGDLWEWNLDWLADYMDPCTDCADVTVVPVSAGRVVRGGNFAIDASNLLSPYRDEYGPVARSNYIGFRCARAP